MLESGITTLEQLRLRYPDTTWPRITSSDTEPEQYGIVRMRNGNYGFRITGDGLVVPFSATNNEHHFLSWGLPGSMPIMCLYSSKPFDIEDAQGLQTAVLHSQTVLQSFHAIETAKIITEKQLLPFATRIRSLIGSNLSLDQLSRQIGILVKELEIASRQKEPQKALSSVQVLRDLGITRFNEGYSTKGFDLTPDFVEKVCTKLLQQAA